MKLLAKRIRPAVMECIHNRDYEMTWDKNDIVFVVDSPKQLEFANLSKAAGEVLLWSPKFDFQVPFIGYEDDFEIFEGI